MEDWLPSLNALRAFEAVCRHLNYVRAAEELHVTPAAVKQLVRKLEAAVGTRLVQRSGRGLTITAAGVAGFDGLSGGFLQIEKCVSRMRSFSGRKRLIVSVEPSFATSWLVPRLERFRQRSPEIDVLIDSSPSIVDLSKGEADAAIRFGAKQLPGHVVRRLFDETLCAFCCPALRKGKNALKNINDLSRATLIHWDASSLMWASSTRKWMGWRQWLEAVGAADIDWQRGIAFNDYNLAVQAAIAGQGVVLGSLPILHDALEAGLLAIPFKETVHTDIGYDFVATLSSLDRSEVYQFANWIADETLREGTMRSAPNREGIA